MNDTAERWLGVVGFPLYQVSSLGRVRRHPDHPSHLPREALAACPTKQGYFCVRIMRDRKAHWRLVHVLVCEAFHGPKPGPQHEVAHRDGKPGNAREDNLRWATRSSKQADKRARGTHREGEAIPWARLKASQIPDIRMRLAAGEFCSAIAASLDVSEGAINGIRIGRNWKHVK